MKTRCIVSFLLTKQAIRRAFAGLMSAVLLASLKVGHAAQPSSEPIPLKAASPPATSPRPAWNSEVRPVKVATPTGEQVKEITFKKNSLGMEFVRLEAGEFLMGQPERDKNTGPAHRVRITRPFLLGAREVTQAQWSAVMGTTIEQLRKANELPKTSEETGYATPTPASGCT